MPEEDENEENPFAAEFHEDQEAAYLKDPKKALQGFYDREGINHVISLDSVQSRHSLHKLFCSFQEKN